MKYGYFDAQGKRTVEDIKALLNKRRALVKKDNYATHCIEWTGAVAGGYGNIRINSRTERVHRVSWMLNRGPIPIGLEVCHDCDNPSCFNIEHLFLGTHKENMLHACAHNRWANMPNGERCHSHSFTASEIPALREYIATGKSMKAIAREKGVTYNAIRKIKLRLSWKHIK